MDSIVLSKELMELVEVHQVEVNDIVALNSVFDEVPQNLQFYIDYEKYYRDMKFSGMTVIEIDYYTYMYVFY